MKAGELLLPKGRGWNEGQVRELFLSFEADRVMAIPTSSRYPADEWCWDLERDGNFSLRTAYKALVGDTETLSEASTSRVDRWIWKQIWKTPTLPRIKMFFWQMCCMALPTKERIKNRVNLGDAICPMCGIYEETAIHMVRECRVAKAAWKKGGLEVRLAGGMRGVTDWIEAVLSTLGAKERVGFMTQCWAIWWARNQVVFEGAVADPMLSRDICVRILAEINRGSDDDDARGGKVGNSNCGQNTRWQKPPAGVIKINTDAGVSECEGIGLGAVARDKDGSGVEVK